MHTLIKSAATLLLAALQLGPGVLYSQASETRAETGARASAHASARASSSSSVDDGKRRCSAESSSSAEVRVGDRVDRDQDHDEVINEEGGCSASSKATASAKLMPTD